MKLKRFLSGVLIFSMAFVGLNVCAEMPEAPKKEPMEECREIRNELIRIKYGLKMGLDDVLNSAAESAAINYIKELDKQGRELCPQRWFDKCYAFDEEGIDWNCDKVQYLFENCKLKGKKCPKLKKIAELCARRCDLSRLIKVL